MACLWQVKEFESKLITPNEFNLSPLTLRVLANRGIKTQEEIKNYLIPSLKNLPPPFSFTAMDLAVERILKAIQSEEKILIYGDYDVDGITSIALLVNFFKEIGVHVDYYQPDRFSEGYGLNQKAMDYINSKNIKLMITVDCGISNFVEVKYAKQKGIDVIITDHHHLPEVLPNAFAIIHPRLLNESLLAKEKVFLSELAGVGVAFYLAMGLRAYLRSKGFFTSTIKEPNLTDYLDLVALGTISDVAGVVGVNRILVKGGLQKLSERKRIGLQALMEKGGVKTEKIRTGQIGFVLGPRLNSSGRISHASQSVKLLLTEDKTEASFIALQLEEENRKRQNLQSGIYDEILQLSLNEEQFQNKNIIILYDPKWHIGVIGIVASKIVEKFQKPCVLLTDEAGLIKGSARSVRGVHITNLLKEHATLLKSVGGHTQAAGLSLIKENFAQFKQALEESGKRSISAENLVHSLEIDGAVSAQDINMKCIQELECLEPFGPGNEEPIFCMKETSVVNSKVLADKHIKVTLMKNNLLFSAIGFNMAKNVTLKNTMDIAFTPELNDWNSIQSIQLRIKDIV